MGRRTNIMEKLYVSYFFNLCKDGQNRLAYRNLLLGLTHLGLYFLLQGRRNTPE